MKSLRARATTQSEREKSLGRKAWSDTQPPLHSIRVKSAVLSGQVHAGRVAVLSGRDVCYNCQLFQYGDGCYWETESCAAKREWRSQQEDSLMSVGSQEAIFK